MATSKDAQTVRQSLLRLLQASAGSEERALARLQARHPQAPVYATLLSLLTHLDFPEAAARRHWGRVQAHRAHMRRALRRDPGLRVALLDYFVNQTRVLRNPKVIEMALYQRTEQTALTDPLTGLFNRAYLGQVLRREIARATRHERPLAVVLFDIDDFKHVNDSLGHAQGDRVLARAAAVITEGLREVDVAVRYGGEEFVLVLPDTGADGAFVVAQRIRRAAEASLRSGRKPVTLSGGVAAFPADGATAQQLLQKADQGLYRAKAGGKNRIAPVGTERRRHGRRRWEQAVGVARADGRLIDGRGHNISEGGMLVSMGEPVRVGSRVTVMVHSEAGREGALALRGQVVRTLARGGRHLAGLRLASDETGRAAVLQRLLPAASA